MASATSIGMQRTTGLSTVKTMADLVANITTGAGFRYTLVSGGVFAEQFAYAVIQAQTQAIYWTDDNSTPSTTNGFLLNVGERVTILRSQFGKFKCIEATASAALMLGAYKN